MAYRKRSSRPRRSGGRSYSRRSGGRSTARRSGGARRMSRGGAQTVRLVIQQAPGFGAPAMVGPNGGLAGPTSAANGNGKKFF